MNLSLIQISRKTLEYFFNKKKKFIPDNETKKNFSKKQACFVTITKNKELRGCIGNLEPRQELWKNVVDNSLNSAFQDSRFMPLAKYELAKIKIEISVLSIPKKIEFKNEKDLLNKINKKMGLILKKGYFNSTFLPQVWKQIPSKISFLQQLSLKAGLDKNDWKNSEIFYYFVRVEKE